MTNHPRRSMKLKTLHDTLVCGTREWSWKVEVTVGGRVFHVTRKSRIGAFGDVDIAGAEDTTTRRIVEAFLDGTLRNQTVKEIVA